MSQTPRTAWSAEHTQDNARFKGSQGETCATIRARASSPGTGSAHTSGEHATEPDTVALSSVTVVQRFRGVKKLGPATCCFSSYFFLPALGYHSPTHTC